MRGNEESRQKKNHVYQGKLDVYSELELFFPKVPVPQFKGDCKGHPTDWWFPEHGPYAEARETISRAREICMNCPVREECLDFALSFPNLQGIWGGLSPRQRQRERKVRFAAKQRELKKQKQEEKLKSQ